MLAIVNRSYPTLDVAKRVVTDLEGDGFQPEQLNLIGCASADTASVEGAMPDASAGSATGLLAGLRLMTVPGLGPFASVGWLAASIAGGSTGALVGSVVGALAAQFTSPEEANGHAGVLQRGGSLVTVRGDDNALERARNIMDRGEPISPDSSSEFYDQDVARTHSSLPWGDRQSAEPAIIEPP